MTTAARRLRSLAISVVLACGAFACGQQGPLVLPESARPIERLPQTPPAAPTAEEPEDDERTDER